MYSDVEIQVEEIDSLLDEFRTNLKGIDRLSIEEKRQRFVDINRIAQQVRTAKEAYVLELRGLPPEDARELKAELDDRMNQFKNLTTEYEWKKTEISRDQLTSGAAYDTEVDIDAMNRDQLVAYGDDTQDKTQESINRMKRMVGETEQIGNEIVHKMDEQTEQMARVHEKMNDIEYNLKRAKKTMRSIARNAVTDSTKMRNDVFKFMYPLTETSMIVYILVAFGFEIVGVSIVDYHLSGSTSSPSSAD